MGTSVNVGSPNNNLWRIALSTLGTDVPVERQSALMWHAAALDRQGGLFHDLTNDAVAAAFQVAVETRDASAAARAFDQLVLNYKYSGLYLQWAKRALVRTARVSGSRTDFVAELLSEVASYYISRDLPSFVGARSRIETMSQALELKDRFLNIARSTARRVVQTIPSRVPWGLVVERTLEELQRTPGRQ